MSDSRFPRRPLSEKNPYHLDEFREREIIYFCLQYKGWKKRLNSIAMKGNQDEWSDPTAEEAIERVLCEKNINLVEDACKRAYLDEWELILQGVTDPNSTWYNHKLIRGLNCGRDKYYELKHQVYFYVSQNRG